MCDCPRHQDEAAACTCICDEHANFEAARDLAMKRHDAIRELERELEQAEGRAELAERRWRAITSVAEGGIGNVALGESPPPLFG